MAYGMFPRGNEFVLRHFYLALRTLFKYKQAIKGKWACSDTEIKYVGTFCSFFSGKACCLADVVNLSAVKL